MKKLLLPVLAVAAFAACLCSCAPQPNDEPQIYTSLYAIYDFAVKIAGDHADVYNLVGAEPHDWEPTAADMARLEQADILVLNGLGLENWADKLSSSLSNKKLTIVKLADTITEQNEAGDPHVWLNPHYALKQMEIIKDILSQADSSNAKDYEANYEAMKIKIEELDLAYKSADLSGKRIVVAHGAYGHLCQAYGMEQVSVDGLGGEGSISPAKMAEIISFIRDNDIKYIFFEELSNTKVIDTIANEAGVLSLALNPLEGLTAEELQNGDDYFSIMYRNLENIKIATRN